MKRQAVKLGRREIKRRTPASRVTYADINKYLLQHFGFAALNSWIAEVKEMHGIPTRRPGFKRTRACPEHRRVAITNALRALKLLDVAEDSQYCNASCTSNSALEVW